MSRPIVFLSVEHLQAIHDRVIRRFGGDGALRDRGLLESAAAMPAAQFDDRYLHPTVHGMAAAYLFHLCKNHPYVDGNKRLAVVAAEVFLMLNGYALKAANAELEQLTLGIADGTISKAATTRFFRAHATRLRR